MEFGIATSITDVGASFAAHTDAVLDKMAEYNMDTIRLAMNNNAIQSGTRPYVPSIITYILETTNYIVISDPDHTFPQGTIDNWSYIPAIVSRCKEVIGLGADYGDRFIVEPWNESMFDQSEMASFTQEIIDQLRAYGYTGWILYNLLNGHGAQYPLNLTDSKVIGGFHNYMNGSTPSYTMTLSRRFSDAGIRCVNTEIGASWEEYKDFNSENVQEITDFFKSAFDEGWHATENCRKICPLLWMSHNIDNFLGIYTG